MNAYTLKKKYKFEDSRMAVVQKKKKIFFETHIKKKWLRHF